MLKFNKAKFIRFLKKCTIIFSQNIWSCKSESNIRNQFYSNQQTPNKKKF